MTDALEGFHLVGRGGLKLQDAWADGMEAYLGVAVAGFPNAFLLLGPNYGLGHNSVVFMAEAQINYVMQALRLLAGRRAGTVAVRDGAQRRYNADIQARLLVLACQKPEEVDSSRAGQTHWSIKDLAQYAAAHPELGSERSRGTLRHPEDH